MGGSLLYIKDYNRLSQPRKGQDERLQPIDDQPAGGQQMMHPNDNAPTERGIAYPAFIGKCVGIYTTAGRWFYGVIVRIYPGWILIALCHHRRRRVFRTCKVFIRKSRIVAVERQFV